jgi:hypothetical protein
MLPGSAFSRIFFFNSLVGTLTQVTFFLDEPANIKHHTVITMEHLGIF